MKTSFKKKAKELDHLRSKYKREKSHKLNSAWVIINI